MDQIKVENGLINYNQRYEHPIGTSKKYSGASIITINGEFDAKEKILTGRFEYTVSHSTE